MSAPVTVRISLKPHQLLGVNEVDQSISMNAWMTESWHDDYLYWDPATFGNITEIRLPVDSVWRPDTYLYNNLEMDAQAVQRLINVIVETLPASQTTKVTMMYPAIFHTSCLFKIDDFPFDKQVCHLIFASWTYDIKTLDYYPADGNLVPLIYFIQNQEWDVLRFNVTRVEVKYACCPHPYVNLEYTMVMQRKPPNLIQRFYILNVVIPFLIVAFTNFFGFFTLSSSNGERSEKITLGITTLLAMAVILLQVAEQLLARLIITLILMVGVAAVLTCIIMHWQYVSESRTQGGAVIRIFLRCGWWLAGDVGTKWRKQKDRIRYYRKMARQCGHTSNSTTYHTNSILSESEIPLEEVLNLLQKSPSSGLAADQAASGAMSSNLGASGFASNATVTGKSQRMRGTISDYFVAAIALERLCLIAFCSATCALGASFFIYGYSVQELPQ